MRTRTRNTETECDHCLVYGCCGQGLLQCLHSGGGPCLGPDSHFKTLRRTPALRPVQETRRLTRTHWQIRPRAHFGHGALLPLLGVWGCRATAAVLVSAAEASARGQLLLPCASLSGGGGREGGLDLANGLQVD